MEFGFYPERCDLAAGDVQISTLPDLATKRRAVLESKWTHGAWTYAPSMKTRDFLTDNVSELPYSGRIFSLPKTHRLEHANSLGDQHSRFLLWCFGFFVGMRMTDTEAGFLDATPLKPGSLCDFWITPVNLQKAIRASDTFYRKYSSNPAVGKGMTAVIHALFLSQNPLFLHYERFIHLYMCLDGCFFIHSTISGQNRRRLTHAQRIDELCRSFRMTTPTWANPATTTIAAYRNETLHEGLFFGEPLGFQIFGGGSDEGNPLLDIQNLACRIIVGLLGLGHASYVTSPADDRMIGSLEL